MPIEVDYSLEEGQWKAGMVYYPHLDSLNEPINQQLLEEAIKKRFGVCAKLQAMIAAGKAYIQVPGFGLEEHSFTIDESGEYTFTEVE